MRSTFAKHVRAHARAHVKTHAQPVDTHAYMTCCTSTVSFRSQSHLGLTGRTLLLKVNISISIFLQTFKQSIRPVLCSQYFFIKACIQVHVGLKY